MADNNKVDKKEDGSGVCRFNLWFVLTAFSAVVLSAITNETKHEDRTRTQQWAMTVASLSLSFAALACLANPLARDRFVGTPIEGGLAALCLGFWSAGLPSMMNPKTNVALSGYEPDPSSPLYFYGLNPNVYFFTWGAFFVSMLLAGSCLKEVMQAQWPERTFKRTMWWFGLGSACMVVMASASRNFHLADCQEDHFRALYNDSCKRIKLGVALGATGAALAFLMGFASHLKQLMMVECLVGIVMIAMWCCGAGFITFGSKAPAPYIGNLYFSTWAAFTLSAYVGADVMAELYSNMFCSKEQTAANTKEVPAAEPEVDDNNEEKPTSNPMTMEPSNV